MPVSTAAKVEALSVDFRSQAALAEILGVSRSRVTRWLKGAGIDPLNAEKVGGREPAALGRPLPLGRAMRMVNALCRLVEFAEEGGRTSQKLHT